MVMLQQTSHLPIPGGLPKSEISVGLATTRKKPGQHSQHMELRQNCSIRETDTKATEKGVLQ